MRMAAMVRDGDHASYVEANEAFHSCIYEGAGNGYLAELAHSTRQRLQPFRRAQFRALGRLGRSHAEHGLVVDAILQGERSRAQSAMQGHIASVEVAFHELTGA